MITDQKFKTEQHHETADLSPFSGGTADHPALAVMLYRYAQTLDPGFTGTWTFPPDYPDAEAVSDYAYEAMCWLTIHVIITGDENNHPEPGATVTRAETAVIFQRFVAVAYAG